MFNNQNNTEPKQNVKVTARTFKLYTKIKDLEGYVIDKLVRFCNQCGTQYKKTDVAVLNRDANASLVAVTCHNCGYQQVFLISHADSSAFQTDVVLDIPFHQISRYSQLGPISSKEVLQLHKHLKSAKTVKDLIKTPELVKEKH